MAQVQNVQSPLGTSPLPRLQSPKPAGESTGVETLIDRLRDEGIAQGRSQAEALIVAAQKQASDIVAAAQAAAEGILTQAKQEDAKLRAAGESAIGLAMRDTLLSLEAQLIKAFRNQIGRLTQGLLADPVFLQRLILEIASKAAPAVAAGERVEVLLPVELVSMEDLQRKPEQASPGTLMHFVLSLGGGLLREGLVFGVTADGEAGIRVRLLEDDVRIDLTETAISELLLQHLLPRFRALLRGHVAIEAGDTKQPAAMKRT